MAFNVKYTFDLVDKMSKDLERIKKNLKNADNAVKKSSSVFKRSTNAMKKGLASVKNAAASLTSGLKGLVVGFLGFQAARGAISTLADFGTSMSKVKAVTGATNEQMMNMKKLARDLGETTEFSASQAAEGMSFLGMAGFEANQILESMPAVLDLATAGQLGLAEASDISSNVMAGFNMEASQMGRITDVMAIAASGANTNVSQFGEAMKFVAPVAATAGISIEKTAAAIGVLSDAGLQSTMAGTGFRRVISSLAKPTKEAGRVLAKLGLTFEDVNPQTNEMSDILTKLQPLTKDIGAAMQLFGDRGGPAFAVLSKGIPKLRAMEKAMLNGEGAAKKMANTMRDNLGGDIKGLQSAIESMVLSTGEKGLTGSLRRATQGLTNFFRAMAGNTEARLELGEFGTFMLNLFEDIGTVFKFIMPFVEKFFGILNKGLGLVNKLTAPDIETGTKEDKFGFGVKEEALELINKRQLNQNLNAKIDVGFKNAPRGTVVESSSTGNANVNVGTNMTFAGAR